MNERERRLKRLKIRSWRRGTKEMDWLLGKYVEAHLDDLDEAALTLMDAFLMRPDPELENWLMRRVLDIDPEFQDLVAAIQAFHKL